jgi:hypothetical protein
MAKDKMQEDEFVVSGNTFWSPKVIGDQAIGFFLSRELRPNKLKPGTMQEVYTLRGEDGVDFCVAGRMMLTKPNGQKISSFPGWHGVKLGQKLKVVYKCDKPNADSSKHATKICETSVSQTINEDIANEVIEDSFKVTSPEIPFE